MNTSALKSFAPAVRTQLMEAVTRKLDYVLTADTPDLRQAAAQVSALRKEATKDRQGLIERVAYTWFNRLAALRFVDARGWHPFRARVLTPATPEETQPELLKLMRSGSLPDELRAHTDLQRLNDLLDGRLPTAIKGADPQGEVYRHLVLAACRCYHALLPNLFEAINDETELLLPDDLLTATSVAEGFRTEITDDDCAEVEVLGWLYQFYISERKDQVMARKSAVPTEDIPAVTQLFTPHWIVRYLVENSLGRLWLLNRPGSRLREHMPYYIEGEPETDFLKITKPEEIRLCDPAVGSGHMLTYAFDLLTLIYEEEGYAPTEIPALILRHNLHGLEICPRAAQLAELALVFKAREKSRRFFQPEQLVRPNIVELKDIRFEEGELTSYFKALDLSPSSFVIPHSSFLRLLHQFEEAKNFGSLIQPCLDERTIAEVRRAIEGKDLGGQLFLRETHLKVLRVLEQAEALTQRYHVVVANPPYMGGKQFNSSLKEYAKEKYPAGLADAFAMFIERGLQLTLASGITAMVTMESWMFLSSYEALRRKLLHETTMLGMVHMPYLGKGGTSMGINFGTAATIWWKHSAPRHSGDFQCIRYYECDDNGVPVVFPTPNEKQASASALDFAQIPGVPIAYSSAKALARCFEHSRLLKDATPFLRGMATGDNGQFLRLWHEVSKTQTSVVAFDCATKWKRYNKGGDFRKWYGNRDWIVAWNEAGEEIKNFKDSDGNLRSRPQNTQHNYAPAVSYSSLTSGTASFRFYEDGFIHDQAGNFAPGQRTALLTVLALLNSIAGRFILKQLNPTLNILTGDLNAVPFPAVEDSAVIALSEAAVSLARADWDNFETSWDFRDQPLLRPGLKGATLEASWRNWEAQSTAAIRRMQELETENNRLFIAAYGLDGELQPAVPEEQITLARADARRDMGAFLSYAVGCMMGRYSPDHPGLILANAGDTVAEYLAKVGKPPEALTFPPDEDGIIPVLDGEWFEDDIVARTRDFLRATFGEATLNENLRFIEDSLGKSLEKHFLNDFYKDHLQTYKKRPIYWLFQSPKKGFSALVYLHRYTRDTCNTLLNRYLRDYLHKLENRIAHLTHVEETATKATEKTAARKEREKLQKALKDCQEWERDILLPLAQKRIDIDLDDGVKVNYLKFGDALAPIPGLAAKEDE